MNSDYYSPVSSEKSEESCYCHCTSLGESSEHDSSQEIGQSSQLSRSVSSESSSLHTSVEVSNYRELDYELGKRERLRKGKECINKLLIEINELEALYCEIRENSQGSDIKMFVSPDENGGSNYISCSNSDEVESYKLPRDRGSRDGNEHNPRYIIHFDPEKEEVIEVYCKLDEFLETKYLRKKVKELEIALKLAKTSSSIDSSQSTTS
ncbi:unnamed protein product [Rodentolepis nana]|uniref:Uncharacterized protein n=1 Tax=Rodentolepis nana TaxID=102285 RepID=A0A0R3TXN8_RODNA|nr:unnamed protein product [Rodentolepis nana]